MFGGWEMVHKALKDLDHFSMWKVKFITLCMPCYSFWSIAMTFFSVVIFWFALKLVEVVNKLVLSANVLLLHWYACGFYCTNVVW